MSCSAVLADEVGGGGVGGEVGGLVRIDEEGH